jgi:hypothetical protein
MIMLAEGREVNFRQVKPIMFTTKCRERKDESVYRMDEL